MLLRLVLRNGSVGHIQAAAGWPGGAGRDARGRAYVAEKRWIVLGATAAETFQVLPVAAMHLNARRRRRGN